MPSVHTAVHKQISQNAFHQTSSDCLCFPIKLYQQMPRRVLVVMLPRIALWETAAEVDWLHAYWEFTSNKYTLKNFWHTADFACSYIEHSMYYLSASQYAQLV